MSSYGGETPINVPNAIFSGSGVVYTVPAGKYTRVVGIAFNSAIVTIGGFRIDSTSVPGGTTSVSIVLSSGQTISIAGSTGNNLQLGLIEYNNPS